MARLVTGLAAGAIVLGALVLSPVTSAGATAPSDAQPMHRPARPRAATVSSPSPTGWVSLSRAATARVSAAHARAAVAEPASRPTRHVRTVYLTFDDGPSPYTARVLAVLRRHHATATFFELGDNLPRRPHARSAIRRQGSTIGDHTFDHRSLVTLSNAGIRREVRRGPYSRCVRPPYGAVNARVRRVLHGMHKRIVLWTADTRDWSRPGRAAILRGALLDLHDGSIILMHDGGGDRSQTVAALPRLLHILHARGYRVAHLPYC